MRGFMKKADKVSKHTRDIHKYIGNLNQLNF